MPGYVVFMLEYCTRPSFSLETTWKADAHRKLNEAQVVQVILDMSSISVEFYGSSELHRPRPKIVIYHGNEGERVGTLCCG